MKETAQEPGLSRASEACNGSNHISLFQTSRLQSLVNDRLCPLITKNLRFWIKREDGEEEMDVGVGGVGWWIVSEREGRRVEKKERVKRGKGGKLSDVMRCACAKLLTLQLLGTK